MIQFERFTLKNGLRLITHEDRSSPMVAFCILYNVGSRDEDEDKTGYAHLFEHLMFSGSDNVPEFDEPIQKAGGENNAFTNTDITCFYEILPYENIETAFWIESDRMEKLKISDEALRVQRSVVLEEFKETCLNQPYGDAWHRISAMAYKKHPYRWPTIGLKLEHIEKAKKTDLEHFFNQYYCPNNAVLVVTGNIAPTQAFELTQKWFGHISEVMMTEKEYKDEDQQIEKESQSVSANVPLDAIYLAFHMVGRMDPEYYASDLLSDALANGRSSRFYQKLVKEKSIFTQLDAYISGTRDPGLFIIEGKPSEGMSVEDAINHIWHELETIKSNGISENELKKLQNKVEASIVFSDINILNKALNLAYYENLGDADLVNQQIRFYNDVKPGDIKRVAQKILNPENCSELIYFANSPSGSS